MAMVDRLHIDSRSMEVSLVQMGTEHSIFAAYDAAQSWLCVDGDFDYGAGDWSEHCDLQRCACGVAEAIAVP